MLKKDKGSDVSTLSRELGWQHHSTRAALTELRKAGFMIERTQSEGGATSLYRITAEPEATLAK
jgi:DNA-binding transcriptional regulator PaaX